MGFEYDPTLGLSIGDSCLFVIYSLLLAYELFIVFRYLLPLKIKSPYVITFYVLLGLMVLSNMFVLFCRLVWRETGY